MANFSVCRAFWSFWAPKGHDITTTKRIYDCRLRVSCIKEYKRLFNVLSVLKRYSPYSFQVNRFYPLGHNNHILVISTTVRRRRVVEGFARKNLKTSKGSLSRLSQRLCEMFDFSPFGLMPWASTVGSLRST